MIRRSTHAWVAAAVAACLLSSPAGAGRYLNKEFPNFTAEDVITGQRISLEDLRGKVVLVDFWATWCPPCRAEIPNVKRMYRKDTNRPLINLADTVVGADEGRFSLGRYAADTPEPRRLPAPIAVPQVAPRTLPT